jgi:AraC-like DNA-binding protein
VSTLRNYVPIQAPTIENPSLDSSYTYHEYLPSPALSPYVACYWTLDYTAASLQQPLHRILPDGCVDIIFNLKVRDASTSGFITGLMSSYEAMRLMQDQSLFGIRFFAESVRPFIHYPASEFREGPVFLEEAWGLDVNQLNEEMVTAMDSAHRMDLVERFLIGILGQNNVCSEPLLEHGMQYLYAAKGRITVRALAEKLNYSERTIRRAFQKELGVSPKEMSEIIRFQNLLQELHQANRNRFPDIAAQYGYYDQPHFINNFRRLYGMSPIQALK